jgi:hypothetical protein
VPRPSVIVFEVNETLSDMALLAARFADVGEPDLLARVWFASLLRDGFAPAAAGGKESFTGHGDYRQGPGVGSARGRSLVPRTDASAGGCAKKAS